MMKDHDDGRSGDADEGGEDSTKAPAGEAEAGAEAEGAAGGGIRVA